MKKLLIYYNSMKPLGGIERVIANLSNYLADYYDITVLVKDELITSYKLDERIKLNTLNCNLELNMNSRFQRFVSVFKNIFESKKRLRSYFKDNKFDYIYTAYITNATEVYFADKSYRDKLVVSEHASYYAYNRIYKIMKNWLYPKIKALSIPTTMDTEIYKDKGYNAFYIPHLTTFTNVVQNNLGHKKIINVGRLTEDKQQEMLLDIWKKVNDAYPEHDYELLIIGSGEEEDRLKDKINLLNLSNVKMIPHTPNIDEYYKNADLFVFTSRMEGFGMVLLEAMSFSVPCISFDCPSGPRDIVKDGYNGYLISCYDKEMYSKKIIDYMKLDDSQKKQMSKNAGETIINWDNGKIIDSWIKLFDYLDLN